MSEEVVILINDGKIRGIKNQSSFSGAEFYSFYAIPYAQPPIDDLRFKDPLKVTPWDGIRNATIEKEGCTQYSLEHNRYLGSEDCLYVNIHTPNLPVQIKSLKAVIVLIHPCGNVWGSPDSSGQGSPDFVMNHDVVYVTIGYRLNILGFLNLNLENCSGNQGLKDIILAFHWIKDNIQFFNGDPNNITALGCSSGATNIHFLLLSPAAKGLFHKAIIMGNYAFDCLQICPSDQIKLAFDFARELDFKGNDTEELLSFFKSLPALTLITKMLYFRIKIRKDLVQTCHIGGFTATIDNGKHAILPISPRKLIQYMEPVPLMFGICDREAVSAFTHFTIQSTERNFKKAYRQNPWGWMYHLDDHELDEIHQKVETFYSHNIPQDNSSIIIKEAILSDAVFSEVYDTLINFTSAKIPSSVFVYKFSYVSEINAIKEEVGKLMIEPLEGTFHSDDFSFWALLRTPKFEKTKKVIHTFTKLLTTFAKTGDPNYETIQVQWKPSTLKDPYYLSITDELKLIRGKLNGNRYEFWDELLKQYRHDFSTTI